MDIWFNPFELARECFHVYGSESKMTCGPTDVDGALGRASYQWGRDNYNLGHYAISLANQHFRVALLDYKEQSRSYDTKRYWPNGRVFVEKDRSKVLIERQELDLAWLDKLIPDWNDGLCHRRTGKTLYRDPLRFQRDLNAAEMALRSNNGWLMAPLSTIELGIRMGSWENSNIHRF